MTINDEILIIANRIANAGKKPTVALIKAKLSKSVPLPIIISMLKGWQHDPSLVEFPQQEESKSPADIGSGNAETDPIGKLINDELAQMKQEITELKLMIQQLLEQQKNGN